MNKIQTNTPRILIVDDAKFNIDLLGDLLRPDYHVSVAITGEIALKYVLSSAPPDLILLDIVMPGMDGYEVLVHLKADERTRDIPVIFITSKTDKEDEAKGLELGAADYITKPFVIPIVKARIKTHLDLKHHRDHLEKRVQQRTNELIATSKALKNSMETVRETQDRLLLSAKMATLGGLVAASTHEINTPLGIGITLASHVNEKTKKIKRDFTSKNLTRSDFERYIDGVSESIGILSANLDKAAELIRSLKIVAVDQCSEKKRRYNLSEYINEVLISLKPNLKKFDHEVRVTCASYLTLTSYPGALSQILSNLIMNSLIHGFEKKDKGHITIKAEEKKDHLNLTYSDDGRGIEASHISKIFDPFFTTKDGAGGSGLGLHIVYDLVTRKLGGDLSCESVLGQSTTFTITLPFESP